MNRYTAVNGGCIDFYSPGCSSEEIRPIHATHFIDNADGTVQDLSFGLMWEKATITQSIDSLSLAQEYCSNLILGGFSNWRIPSMKELVSLLDFRVRVTMNRVFPYFSPGSASQALFSATLYPAGTPPNGVWAVRFNLEFNTFTPLVVLKPLEDSNSTSVKCVRNVN